MSAGYHSWLYLGNGAIEYVVCWRNKGPENYLWLIICSVSHILPERQKDNYWKSTLIWMYLINFFSIVSSWSFPTGSSEERSRHVRGNIQLCIFYLDLQRSGDAIILKHSHRHVLDIYYSISTEKVVYGLSYLSYTLLS